MKLAPSAVSAKAIMTSVANLPKVSTSQSRTAMKKTTAAKKTTIAKQLRNMVKLSVLDPIVALENAQLPPFKQLEVLRDVQGSPSRSERIEAYILELEVVNVLGDWCRVIL